MIYLIIIFLVFVSFHTLSYAKYIWNVGNKLGAISVIILNLVAVIFPLIVAFVRL